MSRQIRRITRVQNVTSIVIPILSITFYTPAITIFSHYMVKTSSWALAKMLNNFITFKTSTIIMIKSSVCVQMFVRPPFQSVQIGNTNRSAWFSKNLWNWSPNCSKHSTLESNVPRKWSFMCTETLASTSYLWRKQWACSTKFYSQSTKVHTSCRRRAGDLPRSTIWRIPRRRLTLKAYRIHLLQALPTRRRTKTYRFWQFHFRGTRRRWNNRLTHCFFWWGHIPSDWKGKPRQR